MQAASPFLAVQDTPQPAPAVCCRQASAKSQISPPAGAAHEARVATPSEISQAINIARESHAKQKPSDFIEVLARVQGHDEEHISKAVLELGDKIASTVSPYAPLVPFAGKLIAPSAFYDAFDHLHKIARVLLSPVIYAEDTDAIGTASANPIAAAILADEIRISVHKRFGIRPFVTTARLDYESWTFLTRKHFEL